MLFERNRISRVSKLPITPYVVASSSLTDENGSGAKIVTFALFRPNTNGTVLIEEIGAAGNLFIGRFWQGVVRQIEVQ